MENEAPSAGNGQTDRMMQDVENVLSTKDLDLETISRSICKRLHIKYDKLSKDEVVTLIGIDKIRRKWHNIFILLVGGECHEWRKLWWLLFEWWWTQQWIQQSG